MLEALLDRGRGPVARVLVQDGTLRVGDFVLAGAGFGKVRAMTNEHGKQHPGGGPVDAGRDPRPLRRPGRRRPMHAVKDAEEGAGDRREPHGARWPRASSRRPPRSRSKSSPSAWPTSGQQELRVIIKGDVQGSVEAVADALAKLSTEKVRLSIIHAGVGAITEGDINLAIASKAIVIGFNVRPAGKSASLAEENKIEIRLYSIIYNARRRREGRDGRASSRRRSSRRSNGKAEVRADLQGQGRRRSPVATSPRARSSAPRKVRLLRDGAVIWDGKIAA